MPHIHRLIRSRRRSLALIVERDGSLTVRAPQHLSQAEIDHFVDRKSDWIARKQAQVAREAPPERRYEEGETFPYLGVEHPLRLVSRRKPALALEDGCFTLDRARVAEGQALFTEWYRRAARRHLEERVKHFSQLHGFRVGKLRISSARTRWGSCSKKGTLSFTWRLVMAPPEVVDYVVVHELCHLRELNHSKAFWALVASILPDYKVQRTWLKRHGERLRL
jgi:predicted metal-dependent hydrolase